jgi:chitinase
MKKYLLIFLLSQIITLAQKKEIVAYYPEWGPARGSYYVKNIETTGSADKLTVINYAFVVPEKDSSGNIVTNFLNSWADYKQPYPSALSVDGVADDSTQHLRGEFNQLKKLKIRHPHLKLIVSIGGWTGSTFFSDAALTPESREKFVNDCINKFIYGNLPVDGTAGGKGVAANIFDGFDIDWEFPMAGGDDGIHHDSSDRDNFSQLIALFRKKMNNIRPGLLLTAAIPARGADLWKFNLKQDQEYMNWFNLMTYDFHGGWDNRSNHHTNLFTSPADTVFNNIRESYNEAIRYFLDSALVHPDKIVPGAAFYGRGWKVSDTVNYGLYQPGKVSAGISPQGDNNYHDIIPLLNKGYEYHWDNLALAPWLYNPVDSVFWTFDDSKSIALKTRYVDAYNLRGLMFWEISGDDSIGTLVNTIFKHNMPDVKVTNINKGKKAPSLKIIAPLSGNKIIPGSDVIINIDGYKKDQAIVKVEFFEDNKSLGYCTKSPFNWVWFNVPKGKHKLKVIATDINGNKRGSSTVIVYADLQYEQTR